MSNNQSNLETATYVNKTLKVVNDKAIKYYCVIPGTQELGSKCFADCTELEAVILPDSLKTIGSGAFKNCKKLKNLQISPNVSQIDESVLYGSGIEHLSLNENIASRYLANLVDGTDVNTIELYDGPIIYPAETYFDMEELSDVFFFYPYFIINRGDTNHNDYPKTRNGVLINLMYVDEDGNSFPDDEFDRACYETAIIVPDNVIAIPEGVLSLGDYCIYDTHLPMLALPKSLIHISKHAFDLCDDMSLVHILVPAERFEELKAQVPEMFKNKLVKVTDNKDFCITNKKIIDVNDKERWILDNRLHNRYTTEETPFAITKNALYFSQYFPQTMADTFVEGKQYFNQHTITIPSLKLHSLLAQLYDIRQQIEIPKSNNEIKRFLTSTVEKYCQNQYVDLLFKTKVWLVTSEDDGKTTVETVNLFTGKTEEFTIPISNAPFKEIGFDALAMYIHSNGNIVMWVDKISQFECAPIVFQMVLLHEFIHLLFDVTYRSRHVDEKDIPSSEKNETLDNTLVLLTYKCSEALSDVIIDFVKNQPKDYNKAIKIYQKSWMEIRNDILTLLKK